MTVGLLLVAHGSADGGSQEVAWAIAKVCESRLGGKPVGSAFLDHGPVSPTEGIAALQARGAQRAVVVPLLLGAAFHLHDDLPAQLSDALPVVVTPHLGPDPRIISVLAERAGSCDAVILVAAGTRDLHSQAESRNAGEQLGALLEREVIVAFATAASPDIETAAARFRADGKRAVVVPYLLAPGHFSVLIDQRAEQLGLKCREVIGAHEAVVAVTLDRLSEALHPCHPQEQG